VYPTSGSWPITSDVTGNNWHISGTIGDYSGFGLGFDGCSRVDASAYRGISFTISGSVPMGNMVTLGMGTLNDTIAPSWLNAHGGGSRAQVIPRGHEPMHPVGPAGTPPGDSLRGPDGTDHHRSDFTGGR
jgi:hypothetical protein